MPPRPQLYLIDGNSQMYRAYHAPIRTGEGTLLRNASGVPTNAVFIFVTMLRKLLKEHAPAYIAASFDLPGPTFRDELAPDYKANRRPMPDDLAAQIPLVHQACEALGVPIVTHARYEADDVIGTLAVHGAAAGCSVVIVTGDKDFFQLVGDDIRVFNPRDDGIWYDAEGVKEKFGVRPDQVVDVLSLMGDAVDNVKGVPGIGEKGATELINTYGSLESLLAHAAEIKQKRYREGLTTYADQARQSRQLVTIHTDLDIPFELDAFRFKGADRDRCYALFSKLEFRTLVPEYAPSAASVKKDYALIESADELKALAEELKAAGRFSMKVITDGTAPVRATLVGIAITTAGAKARYVPLGHEGFGSGVSISKADALKILAPVLTDPSVEKIGHDLKADLIVLGRHGVDVVNPRGFDTMIASYLIDANRSSQALEPIALEQLGYKALTEDEVDRKSTRLNSSHVSESRMPSSA